jgi:transposase
VSPHYNIVQRYMCSSCTATADLGDIHCRNEREKCMLPLSTAATGVMAGDRVHRLLAYMERSASESRRATLASYRIAYMRGSAGESCLYRCDATGLLGVMYEP